MIKYAQINKCLTWLLLIPVDYVKSNLQRSKEAKTITGIVTQAYRAHGPTDPLCFGGV